MDRMGEMAAEMLLDALAGRRYDGELVIKVAPRFFTAEQANSLPNHIVT